MLRAWRLAISTLSGRPSRTALLTLTVACSAALIAAVSSAMNSVQASARRQADQTLGSADVRIKPLATGKRLDATLLEVARRWEGVGRATGKAEAPILLSTTLDMMLAPKGDATGTAFLRGPQRLSHRVMAGALDPFDTTTLPPLEEGRYPSAPGEIAVEATLMVRLSHAGMRGSTSLELPSRRGGRREHLRGPAPRLPDSAASAEEAGALNQRVGVRCGDVVKATRQSSANVNIGAILSNPGKAAELAKAAGLTPGALGGVLAGAGAATADVRIVGVLRPPPFGGRPRAFMTLETLHDLAGGEGRFDVIEIDLRGRADPDAFVAAHQAGLPEGVMIQTGAKVTAGLDDQIEASRLGFLLATTMAFLCAGFIITTAMTTGVAERLRELGVLRCIGAGRWQLAQSQLWAGGLIGLIGAGAGVPLGVGAAWLIVLALQRQVEVSLAVAGWGVAMALAGSVVAGLGGAAVPAVMASRVSPLEALAARSVTPRRRGVVWTLVAGAALVAVQVLTIVLTRDGQARFWLYVTVGLPASFLGFFLLAVPVMLGVSRLAAGAVSRAFGLPARVLGRTIEATPYRYGFTAGSMMMGLALMVGIWTQGGAIRRDWLSTFNFPDAFVTGLSLDSASVARVRAMPMVERACAITLHPVETGTFGVRALQRYRSTFLAFEPEPFFAMTRPVWVQGDEATAVRRLREGGAVIVAREFQVARGVKVGDIFRCSSHGTTHEFEIVGVVTSPGLEVISQFFSIGDDFTQQSLHAVFGSRDDLREKFGSEAVHLIQIALKEGVDDEEAVARLREELADAGILDAGSGRRVKEQIGQFIDAGLLGASLIAVIAMAIAGLGVANLIVAGITARRFEFGVLRAVGAGRGVVARLVLGEAVLVGLAAAALGTWMGLQGTWCVQRIDEKLFGLTLTLRPPPGPLAAGQAATVVMTLLAAAPAVLALARRGPRELLGAVRG